MTIALLRSGPTEFLVKNNNLLWLAASLFAGLMSACTAVQTQPAGIETEAAEGEPLSQSGEAIVEAPVPSASAAAQYHLLAGELAANRGQAETAAVEFLAAGRLLEDPELAERATGAALAAENPELAREAAQLWLDLAPTQAEPREVLLRLALIRSDQADVESQSKALVEGHAAGPGEGLRQVALLISQGAGTPELALDVIQSLVEGYPDLPAAYYAEGLVAMRFEQLDRAESAARKALALEADNADAALLLTGIQVRQGKIAESGQTLRPLLAAQPEQAQEYRLTYARLLLDAGEREAARSLLQEVVRIEPGNVDARFSLAAMALNDGQDDEAEAQFRAVSEDSERGADARFQLALIAERDRRFEEAVSLFESVNTGTQALEALISRSRVLAKLGRIDEARSALEMLAEQFPPLAPRMLIAQGEILIQAGRSDEALSIFDQALAERPGDAEILYSRSLAHEQTGRFDLAEADLRQILSSKPEDPQALNALGYMLSVHTDRYSEARAYISKALEQSPDDAAIIDSMGWVEFKLGRLPEARTLLERAYKNSGDPEIAAHLGEVLWTSGDQNRARQVWNEALQSHPDHRVLTETMRRLDP